MRRRCAATLADVRTWLGVLMAARGMFDGGVGLLLLSGVALTGLRWRGTFPFVAIGMTALILMWISSVFVRRHLRRIHTAIPTGEGPAPTELREVISRPLAWALVFAMNGAALGILTIMTVKPGWLGAASTVLIAAAVGGGAGAAAVRRERVSVLRAGH
jgi:hypothetical protein